LKAKFVFNKLENFVKIYLLFVKDV